MGEAYFIGVVFSHDFGLDHLEEVYVMPGKCVVDPSAIRAGKGTAKAMLIFFTAPAERAFCCADV